MDPLFRVLPAGRGFWHGSDQTAFALTSVPLWVSDTQAACEYGRFIHRVTATRDLKLIDVSQPLFHLDFIGRLNSAFVGSDGRLGVDRHKMVCMAPLGLPNLETVLRILSPAPGGMYRRPPDTDPAGQELYDTIMEQVGCFGGHHRYSVRWGDGTNADISMVLAMQSLYPSYHGYTCPIAWPTVHSAGFLQPEVCIFDAVASGLRYDGFQARQAGGAASLAATSPHAATRAATATTTRRRPSKVPAYPPHDEHGRLILPSWVDENGRRMFASANLAYGDYLQDPARVAELRALFDSLIGPAANDTSSTTATGPQQQSQQGDGIAGGGGGKQKGGRRKPARPRA